MVRPIKINNELQRMALHGTVFDGFLKLQWWVGGF